jgi:hypothetical protein
MEANAHAVDLAEATSRASAMVLRFSLHPKLNDVCDITTFANLGKKT